MARLPVPIKVSPLRHLSLANMSLFCSKWLAYPSLSLCHPLQAPSSSASAEHLLAWPMAGSNGRLVSPVVLL